MPFLSSSLRTLTIQLSYSNIVIINCAGLKFTGSSPSHENPPSLPLQKMKVQPQLQTQTCSVCGKNVQTCARDVLPSCREGSPYVFQLQKPLVFEPAELSNHVLFYNHQH